MAGVVQVVRWRVVAVVAAVAVLAAGAALAPRLLADDPPSAAPGQDCVADADVPLADLADLADVADARWVRFCPLADEGRGELLRHPQGVVTGELAAGTAGTLWETQVDRPLCGAFDAPLAGPTGRFRIEVGLPDGRIADLEGDTGCSTRDLVLFSQLETTLLVDASAAAGAPTPLDPTTCPGRLTTAETNDDGASAGQLVERAEHDALATVPLLPMLAATAEVCAYTGRAGSLTLLDQWRAGPRQAEAIRSTATLAHDRGARTMCDIDPGRTSYLVVLADATGTARTITVDNSECGALDAAVGTPAVSTYLGLARERLDRTIERSRPWRRRTRVSTFSTSQPVIGGEEDTVDDFAEFVAARGPALWRAAWLLTGDRSLAEDLLQTALTRAWPHFGRVSRTGSFEAYVRRTLFTTYAGWRGRRWHGEVPTGALPETGRTDEVPDLDLLRALAGLSPRQRAVVVLRYFEDLTEVQTAAALGCSIGSVKTHHSRALATLRTSPLLDAATLAEEAR